MAPLCVCHLGKYYPPAPGEIETYVRILARAQADLGMRVSVYCVNHEQGTRSVEKDGPVEVVRFRRAMRLDKLDVCPGLSADLKRVEADVLHLHVPNPTMILALLAAKPPQPVVVTYQSDIIRQRVRGFLFRPVERLAYHRVHAIFQTSPLSADGSSFLRPYRDRLDVLANGIELAPYLNPSAKHRLKAARIRETYRGPIWLSCGRLVYDKGLHNAIRALRHVEGTLIIVGGGPLRKPLEAEARRRKVADRVVFAGNLPYYLDIVPYYLAADAFWFPSNARSEGFGIVQVEAMACGVPVINAAIPHSGVAWVSLHGETGLTVPINDPVALANAANRLMADPAMRQRLGAAARARAIREFDHEGMATRSLAVYSAVLGRPERPPEPIGCASASS
jgi:rhamnosyl/mannosyltransferase